MSRTDRGVIMDPDRTYATAGAAEIERAQKAWLKSRLPSMLFVAGTAAAILAMTGLPRWRLVLLFVGCGAMPIGGQLLYVRWLGKNHGAARQFSTVFLLGFVVVAFNTLLTGGLNSPLFVLAMGPIVAYALTVGGRGVRFMVAALFCEVVAFFFLPLSFTSGLFTPIEFRVLQAHSVLSFVGLVAVTLVQNRKIVSDMRVALERVRGDLLEAQAERKRALEMLGAKVAHELRNPLTAIKALVALESRDAERPRSRARLEVVLGEIGRMEQILRDYLTSSKPLEQLELAPVLLESIADEAVSVLEGRASEHGVKIRRVGEGKIMEGDARRLKETLLNLASNAIDATPRGGNVEI
ncbi:MAG: sensor histidine kinase, partial [Myxococcales bacterium]